MADTRNLEAAKRMYRSWHHAQANRCAIGPWESLTDEQRLEWQEKARRASPAAAVPDGALPPLPEPDHALDCGMQPFYRPDQMQAYARAAVEAELASQEAHRAQQGEPVELPSDEELRKLWARAGKEGIAAWSADESVTNRHTWQLRKFYEFASRAATKAAAPADAPKLELCSLCEKGHLLRMHFCNGCGAEVGTSADATFNATAVPAPVPDTGIPNAGEVSDGRDGFDVWWDAHMDDPNIGMENTVKKMAARKAWREARDSIVGRAALTEFIAKYCNHKPELIACAESAFYWFDKCCRRAPVSSTPTPGAVEIHQWRRKPGPIAENPPWYDAPKGEAYARVDDYYEARTVLAAPSLPSEAKAGETKP